MKVLVVHNRYRSSQPSGENVSVTTETELLRRHGLDVRTLSLDSDAIAGWPLRQRMTLPGRVIWSREGRRLTQLAIARFRPEVVHFQNTFPLFSPAALPVARAAGVGVVHTLRNFRPLCPSADLLRDQMVCEKCVGRLPVPALVHACYRDSRFATLPVAAMVAVHGTLRTWRRCVDVFIAPSLFVRSKYVQAGWPSEKFAVKYNTVGDTPIGPARTGQLNGFVCISRLTPEKGVDVLIEAWRRAFPSGREELHIIGAGPQEAELRSLAADVPSIIFRGQLPRTHVMVALANCRAAVVPSRWPEPFGRVVIEAYSLSTPVIASDIGALGETVVDNQSGLLVEPGSPSDLARALRQLGDSPASVAQLGAGARAEYERKYTATATTRQLIGIYNRAVEVVRAGEATHAIHG